MGIITASYALGAVISPVFFDILLDNYGFSDAMIGLAIALLVIAPFIVGLVAMAKVKLEFSKPMQNKDIKLDRMLI